MVGWWCVKDVVSGFCCYDWGTLERVGKGKEKILQEEVEGKVCG